MQNTFEIVSIPFKRESPFGQTVRKGWNANSPLFQFPSNGKALSDYDLQEGGVHNSVSSFNSLQTGKPFRTIGV